ncbi:hypothetical protein HELRODRAFT_167481 [Helobdella robusta]|uniref:Uncharacterized protein n=1 Tax=Helobdella robusta TaxID=6412 RepID=T1EZF0_HELRO|nr:hypothetical protein HELRODRAFT_167481 [Helobdella robusta]ESO10966.1 hypothetical protein HELRODRAFT_167481 [Helobdella robusta]
MSLHTSEIVLLAKAPKNLADVTFVGYSTCLYTVEQNVEEIAEKDIPSINQILNKLAKESRQDTISLTTEKRKVSVVRPINENLYHNDPTIRKFEKVPADGSSILSKKITANENTKRSTYMPKQKDGTIEKPDENFLKKTSDSLENSSINTKRKKSNINLFENQDAEESKRSVERYENTKLMVETKIEKVETKQEKIETKSEKSSQKNKIANIYQTSITDQNDQIVAAVEEIYDTLAEEYETVDDDLLTKVKYLNNKYYNSSTTSDDSDYEGSEFKKDKKSTKVTTKYNSAPKPPKIDYEMYETVDVCQSTSTDVCRKSAPLPSIPTASQQSKLSLVDRFKTMASRMFFYNSSPSTATSRRWSNIEDIPKSIDISKLTMNEVDECLFHLKLDKYRKQFSKNQIDGLILYGLNEQTLIQKFKMDSLEARKLVMFCHDRWRPV